MALPCLGRLRLGALREAPTGVLSEAAARGYDPDGRAAQMLNRIDAYESNRVGEADRNVESYETEVLLMRGMEGEGARLFLLEAESNLAMARLVQARAHREYGEEIAGMRRVVQEALANGLFSIPWDRMLEVELPEQQGRVQRALAQLNRELGSDEEMDDRTSPQYERSPISHSPTSPPPRFSPPPFPGPRRPPPPPRRLYEFGPVEGDSPTLPLPRRRDFGPADDDAVMGEASARAEGDVEPAAYDANLYDNHYDAAISTIVYAVRELGFRYDGMSTDERGRLQTFGNRRIDQISGHELTALFDQARIHMVRLGRYPRPEPPSQEDQEKMVLLEMAIELRWPGLSTSMNVAQNRQALIDDLDMAGADRWLRILELWNQCRSWLAAPPSVAPRGVRRAVPTSATVADLLHEAALEAARSRSIRWPALTRVRLTHRERAGKISRIEQLKRTGLDFPDVAWLTIDDVDPSNTLVRFGQRLLTKLSDGELNALEDLINVCARTASDGVANDTVMQELRQSLKSLMEDGFRPNHFRDPTYGPLVDIQSIEDIESSLSPLGFYDLMVINALGNLWYNMPFDHRPEFDMRTLPDHDMRDAMRHAIFSGFKTVGSFPPGPFYRPEGVNSDTDPDVLTYLPEDDLKALFDDFYTYCQLDYYDPVDGITQVPETYQSWYNPVA